MEKASLWLLGPVRGFPFSGCCKTNVMNLPIVLFMFFLVVHLEHRDLKSVSDKYIFSFMCAA